MNRLLSHAAPVLEVVNIQDSLDFYKAKIGFDIVHSEGVPTNYIILNTGNIYLHLKKVDIQNTTTYTKIFFALENIKLLYEAFKLKGIHFENQDATSFSIKDPDGHLLLFAKYKTS